MLGVPRPKVAALLRGDFTGFSLERLFRLLIALDNDRSIFVDRQWSRAQRPSVSGIGSPSTKACRMASASSAGMKVVRVVWRKAS